LAELVVLWVLVVAELGPPQAVLQVVPLVVPQAVPAVMAVALLVVVEPPELLVQPQRPD